jgi:phenylacetate-CoA ligase
MSERFQAGFDNVDLLRSAVDGMVWPSVPDGAGAAALAMQFQLAQSQCWSPEQLLSHQLQQIEIVLRHAFAHVPHYRVVLAGAGYQPDRKLTREHFAQLPVLTRKAVQSIGAALFAVRMPAGHGNVHAGETSGSTGMPVVFRSSALEQLMWNAATLRDHEWHRRDRGGRLAAIRFAPGGGMTPGWGPATDVAFKTGDCPVLHIETAIDRQVDWLCEQNPVYLLSYPSNLAELARAFIARNLTLPRLRGVRSVSEAVRGDLRGLVHQAWGVGLTDMYTTKEVGYIALQCPDHDVYHVQSENVLVEIVDDDGNPCAPGQTGRVLVTALHNFAMPLIRYEIGDYAVAGEPCACGRGLPVIREILGRSRNMLHLPGGELRWPLCDLVKEPELPGIRQYQYIQKSPEHIEVHLVVGPQYTRVLEPTLEAIVQRRLGYPFKLSIFYHDDIARSASGKYEDFRCELPG